MMFLLIAPPSNYIEIEDIQTKSEEYAFLQSWGGDSDQIRYPGAVGVGPDGKIYTINNGRMTIIDQQTRTYQVWNGFFTTTTRSSSLPIGLAFDRNGSILFPDTWNDRILKFSPSGDLEEAWGVSGDEPGQFKQPYSIAVDSLGNIYIADLGNERIQKFNSEGVFIISWGLAEVSFTPFSLAMDSFDNLYVVDLGNNCIQEFNQNGNFIKSIGKNYLSQPRGIAINSDNQILIVDNYTSTVEVFNSNGVHLKTIGTTLIPGNEPGQFQWPEGVAVDYKNDIYISDTYNHRVQKLDNNGVYLNSWGTKISTLGEFNNPSGIVIDKDGNLLITDVGNNRIQKTDAVGTYISSWGSTGTAEGQFGSPRDVTIDIDGYIYVADHDHNRIQKFNPNEEFLKLWGYGQLMFPSGIIVNSRLNNVYVVDSGNDRIMVYDREGNYKFSWGNKGSGNGEFSNPQGIALDRDENVYVVDHWNHRIQKFNANGAFLTQWGQDIGSNSLYWPIDITIDNGGYVFVCDTYNHRIQVFDQNGNFIMSWGEFGLSLGRLNHPNGITTDLTGNIFVSDSDNNRIVKFSNTTPISDPDSGLILNGAFDGPIGEWTKGGELPLSVDSINSYEGQSMLLGEPVPRSNQGINQAWAHQTFYVRPEWDRPMLSFKYNMYVNDIMDYSDFFVAIQDGVGLNHLATVVRDGYQPCVPGTAPTAGTNLGWRSVNYDLSAYKGQHVRLVFSNRNLWPISWGIWTYVDDVKVVDAGPLPLPTGSERLYLPAVSKMTCDPVTKSEVKSSENGEGLSRPAVSY